MGEICTVKNPSLWGIYLFNQNTPLALKYSHKEFSKIIYGVVSSILYIKIPALCTSSSKPSTGQKKAFKPIYFCGGLSVPHNVIRPHNWVCIHTRTPQRRTYRYIGKVILPLPVLTPVDRCQPPVYMCQTPGRTPTYMCIHLIFSPIHLGTPVYISAVNVCIQLVWTGGWNLYTGVYRLI